LGPLRERDGVTEIRIGPEDGAHVAIVAGGYAAPQVAAPHGLDVLECAARVRAGPMGGVFDLRIHERDLRALRTYLSRINSGNGPQASFSLAGGLFTLSFAPTRRGPVLCAALIKSIEASHARLEFMITLEPRDITHALGGFEGFPAEEEAG
jgi:hypothetical protein